MSVLRCFQRNVPRLFNTSGNTNENDYQQTENREYNILYHSF